jgi:serine/threonine protein kinase
MTSCGTPLFTPPEVCLGKPYDHKADVWAVGIILYELITLKSPFNSETVNGVL